MIFETHAHYNDRKYDEDRDSLLEALPEQGIKRVVNISASWEDMLHTLDLASSWPFIYAAVGIHPDHVGELDDERFSKLKDYCHRVRYGRDLAEPVIRAHIQRRGGYENDGENKNLEITL